MRIFSYALRLTVVGVVASGLLAYVFWITADPIQANAAQTKQRRIKSLLPPETTEVAEVNVNGVVIFRGLAHGAPCGVVIETAVEGYGGRIVVLVGVDQQDAIRDLAIVEHRETPGLGAKITTPAFTAQFRGRRVAGLALARDQAGGIDAILAATISSRAVLEAARQALEKYAKVKHVR